MQEVPQTLLEFIPVLVYCSCQWLFEMCDLRLPMRSAGAHNNIWIEIYTRLRNVTFYSGSVDHSHDLFRPKVLQISNGAALPLSGSPVF
jgi:hypothetical protein